MRSNFGGRNKSKPIGYAVDWSTDTEKKQKSQQRGSAIVAKTEPRVDSIYLAIYANTEMERFLKRLLNTWNTVILSDCFNSATDVSYKKPANKTRSRKENE
ncbi:hypothetical protein T4D_760 [Trichinella pseudospiralis]|uniref:Uncharacterized protein n=1 Tax=Trichinella pseudospiralis TaxID=6337 RepID=A0A0V1FUM6_TRIPS|nr:hypothetical protein T4D_760 [Trichinella pseudospiralis]